MLFLNENNPIDNTNAYGKSKNCQIQHFTLKKTVGKVRKFFFYNLKKPIGHGFVLIVKIINIHNFNN